MVLHSSAPQVVSSNILSKVFVVKEFALCSLLLTATAKSRKTSGTIVALPGSPQATSHLTKQPTVNDAENDSGDDVDGEDISTWNWRDDDK